MLHERGAKAVSPLSVPLMMGNAAAAELAMRHGLHGQTYGVVSACAAGRARDRLGAADDPAGDADAVVTGGAEAHPDPARHGRRSRAMDATSPSGISRPFDARRDGFVMGEGAGVLVLEDAEQAERRGADASARCSATRATSDAHHLTAPEPTGRDAARAIELALDDAGVSGRTTSTTSTRTARPRRSTTAPRPMALKTALGERRAPGPDLVDQVGDRPPARRRRRGRGDRHRARAARAVAPPTLGYEEPEEGLDLDYVPDGARPLAVHGTAPPTRSWRSRTRSASAATTRCSASSLMKTIAVTSEPRAALQPSERLAMLCDRDRFEPIRTGVASRLLDHGRAPGDGVVAGAGRVDGRPVFCYAQDPSFVGGSLGEAHADTIVRVLRLAGRAGAPVVGFVESGGARMQEGHAALAGYGRIFRESVALSGRVPQISIVTGVSAGGGAYSPALTDFVVMTEPPRMFLTGPRVVREVLGEDVSMEELGGPQVHERNGVCQLVASSDRTPPIAPGRCSPPAPADRRAGPAGAGAEPGDARPGGRRPAPRRARSTTCATWCGRSSTTASCSSCPSAGRATWSPGSPASRAARSAIVANQPRYLGGVIDAEASREGGAVRGHVRPLPAAARGARRHARLHAGHAVRRAPA